MDIGKRIRKLRKEMKWTLKDMSKRTGLSISFLSDIERGVSNPSFKKLKVLAEKLNVSICFLLGEESNLDKKHKNVPVLYTFNNNENTISEEESTEYYTIDLSQENDSEDYFFIKMQDDSMKGSAIIPGSLVLIRKQDYVKNGEIAAVSLDNKSVLLRKVYINNDTIILQAENNEYETKLHSIENVNIIGKVISSRYYFESP